MFKKKLLLFLLVIALFVFSCTPVEKQCIADTDCAPAACCHAADAVNKNYAPSCNGILCTMDCKPGSIDCGQGSLKCVNNECTVVLKE